jgi:Kef-type K+ transport system membrane component KefB
MIEALGVLAAGFAVGGIPTRWLRIPEPIALLVVGALARVLIGGQANQGILNVGAYVGLFALLFGVGVELADLGHRPLTPRGALLATIGALVLCGVGLALLDVIEPLSLKVLALVLCSIPTSAGIAARLLRPHGTGEGSGYPMIISAAVADDFIGIALLVVAPLFAVGAVFHLFSSPTIALIASVLIAIAMIVIRPSRSRGKLLKLSVLTAAGVTTGVSAALLGVFDGHAIASLLTRRLKHWVVVVERLLPTMFFMTAGYAIRLPLLSHLDVLVAGALVLVALFISRLAIAVAAPGAAHTRLAVGAGMLARGEVTIAMALVFLQSRVLTNANYATLMTIVLGSTAISALALKLNQLRR